MKSAKKTKLKKLIVAVASSDARMIDVLAMNRAPAERCPRSASSVGGSTGLIVRRQSAETRKEQASATSATGALKSWTSSPPTLGPPTNENVWPVQKRLKSRFSSRSDGMRTLLLGQRETERDEQHQPRRLRPKLRLDRPIEVGLDQLLDRLAELFELGRRQVQPGVAEELGRLPVLRLVPPPLEPGEQVLEVALRDHGREELGGGRHLRRLRDARPARVQRRGTPRPFSAPPSPRLLDEAVLRELAEVERAARGALADRLSGLGGRQRSLATEQAEERESDRVCDRAQGPWVAQLGALVHSVER